MKKYEYLLLKNKEGLIYNRLFFNNSVDARKRFRKNDVLLKCKADSVYFADNWTIKQEDIVKKYEK